MDVQKVLREEQRRVRRGTKTTGFAPIHKKMKVPRRSKGFVEMGVRHIIV